MSGPISFAEFISSAAASDFKAVKSLSGPLQALWLDRVGKWDEAHEAAQADDGCDSAWVHAYLHRREGDKSNAAYWYQRAGRPVAVVKLEEEWDEIARTLLKNTA